MNHRAAWSRGAAGVIRTSLLVLPLISCSALSALSFAPSRGRLAVLVCDSTTGRPLRDAVCIAMNAQARGYADSKGRCLLNALPEGMLEITSWARWHVEHKDTVWISAGRLDTIHVLLARLPLPPADSLVFHGVVYRVSAMKNMYSLLPFPDNVFETRPLSTTERLMRCDELVDTLLRYAAVDRKRVEFVRNRIEDFGPRGSSVVYDQKHQGYSITGTGARLMLDENGQIVEVWLTYESRQLPTFAPMDQSALDKIAVQAVPFPVIGGPLTKDRFIDPMGDGPARLLYITTFLVTRNGHKEGWMVYVDAVTGEVITSETTTKYLVDYSHR